MSLSRRELIALGLTSFAGVATRGVVPATDLLAWGEPQRRRSDSFEPDVELSLRAAPGEVTVREGRPTRVWRFTGSVVKGPASAMTPGDSYLGPTLRLARGQKVRIRFHNELAEPSIVHWHGMDVPEAADGHPHRAIAAGSEYIYEFTVENRAGTYWYHPHPHERTGPQVNMGLAGLLIVSDEQERALGLPSGDAELTAVIQDRSFDADGQFRYAANMMEREMGFTGEVMLVNGKPDTQWSLGTRAYRLRLLNGSNARIYKLVWSDGTPMTVIGSDGGLLERPVERRAVTLAPGQRVELWLDLSSRPVGHKLELRSEAWPIADGGLDMGGGGGMGMGMRMREGASPQGAAHTLIGITVARRERSSARLPRTLVPFDRSWQPVANAPVRRVPLTFRRMVWFMGGRSFDMHEAAEDETVQAGSTQVWEFENAGGPMGMQMAHPIHMHGRQFRVLSRSGASPTNALSEGIVDAGWMDTVLVLPSETVRVQVTFTQHPGTYLYHCHILEHEDMGMMRNFKVV
ncbi:MAG: bilirubin oxidase [Gemmatimonas sp.]|nr:bilirubin oxidase [Gemmatimonas sp.]